MTDRLKERIDEAEEAYGQMYDAETHSEAAAHYSETQGHLHDAITLATQLGLMAKVVWLANRLHHIKVVFRSQFS